LIKNGKPKTDKIEDQSYGRTGDTTYVCPAHGRKTEFRSDDINQYRCDGGIDDGADDRNHDEFGKFTGDFFVF
jgi:hypothetical protein